MAKCRFYDPVLNFTDYWRVNYLEQDGPTRTRNVSYEGTAKAGFGIIGTEGDLAPLTLRLTGKILHTEQLQTFLDYFKKKYSFYYFDEEGFEYEVTMTNLDLKKRRCHWNPADNTMRYHTWDYTMELRVLRVLSGDLFGRVDL